MYHWYYIWSPKYEIFHQILSNSLIDASGIVLHPIFAKQSYFTRTITDVHFFTGVTVKQFMIEKALREHKGEHIIVTDVDLVITDKNKIADYLRSYEKNDITCMRDNLETNTYNPGFTFVKSTDDTRALYEKITQRIKNENGIDITILNEELASFPGTHGTFSLPEVIQSNMTHFDETLIIQCLCSIGNSSDDILVEKLLTISYFQDFTYFRHFITKPVLTQLIKTVHEMDPMNYISTWDLDLVDEYLKGATV